MSENPQIILTNEQVQVIQDQTNVLQSMGTLTNDYVHNIHTLAAQNQHILKTKPLVNVSQRIPIGNQGTLIVSSKASFVKGKS